MYDYEQKKLLIERIVKYSPSSTVNDLLVLYKNS
jgi:hypothetical protein